MKKVLWLSVAFAACCAVAGLLLMLRPGEQPLARDTAPQPAPVQVATTSLPRPPAPTPAPPPPEPPAAPALVAAPDPAPAPVSAPNAPSKAKKSASSPRPAGTAKEPIRDPLAREALAFVGLDAAAEAYWHAAINDPNLSAHERSDLIEDLNEDGLSDPHHPTPEDLPIIMGRIQLIEAAGPYAMDQVNGDAFQEAYKDLINLANLALGGGQPVR